MESLSSDELRLIVERLLCPLSSSRDETCRAYQSLCAISKHMHRTMKQNKDITKELEYRQSYMALPNDLSTPQPYLTHSHKIQKTRSRLKAMRIIELNNAVHCSGAHCRPARGSVMKYAAGHKLNAIKITAPCQLCPSRSSVMHAFAEGDVDMEEVIITRYAEQKVTSWRTYGSPPLKHASTDCGNFIGMIMSTDEDGFDVDDNESMPVNSLVVYKTSHTDMLKCASQTHQCIWRINVDANVFCVKQLTATEAVHCWFTEANMLNVVYSTTVLDENAYAESAVELRNEFYIIVEFYIVEEEDGPEMSIKQINKLGPYPGRFVEAVTNRVGNRIATLVRQKNIVDSQLYPYVTDLATGHRQRIHRLTAINGNYDCYAIGMSPNADTVAILTSSATPATLEIYRHADDGTYGKLRNITMTLPELPHALSSPQIMHSLQFTDCGNFIVVHDRRSRYNAVEIYPMHVIELSDPADRCDFFFEHQLVRETIWTEAGVWIMGKQGVMFLT